MSNQTVEQVVSSRVKTTKGDPFAESRLAQLARPQSEEQDDAEWEYEYSDTKTEVCRLSRAGILPPTRIVAHDSSRHTS